MGALNSREFPKQNFPPSHLLFHPRAKGGKGLLSVPGVNGERDLRAD